MDNSIELSLYLRNVLGLRSWPMERRCSEKEFEDDEEFKKVTKEYINELSSS